ncbi:unnamed protein product [Polarella glacialis]|uniref:Uncharacterized protein n=1 Tax=Polarella glacialis TaxID=89957 RepID=A0A813II91_POLGL|nr:unnamed protein product [Polarella glacialis]
MAWLAAARFQEQQEVDYCRPKGERALATVTAVSLSKGVFSYHLEYDIGEKSGPAKLQVARDVPEWQLLEMQSSHRTAVAAVFQQHQQQRQQRQQRQQQRQQERQQERQQRQQQHLGLRRSWIWKLKEGDQVFHERCGGEAVEATVQGVCIAMKRQRLRTALVSFSCLVQSGPPVEKRALRLRELQDLRSLIEDRCVGESWCAQQTRKPLQAEEVSLYHLNHFLICPSTVPEGVLMYCPCVDTAKTQCGQAVAQSDSNPARAHQMVGEGEVTGVLNVDGQKWLIVKVCKGRFTKKQGSTLISGHISGRCEDVRTNKVSLSYQEVLRYSKGLLPEAVTPNWFCSHWWGEAVLDFIKCCEKHSATHQLGADSAYWVFAYANRQHELGVDLGSDPMQSSFMKAIELSEGVLLILDPEATPFQRIWCCFEEGIVSLAQRGALAKQPAASDCPGRGTLQRLAARDGQEGRMSALQLDIATVDGEGTAQLMTQGLTKQEKKMEEIGGLDLYRPSGWRAKSEREKCFPLELVSKGLTVKITDAKASQASDRTHILNALAGRPINELYAQPNCDHPKFHQVDATLRGMFAVAAWRAALEQGLDTSEGSKLPLEVALREDVSRQELELNLQGVATQHHLSALCKAVEPLTNLTRWHLDLGHCELLPNIAELGRSLVALTNLRQLTVDLSNCRRLTSIAELGRSLEALTNLHQLTVSLAYCEGLTSIAELGHNLVALTNLHQLTVVLGGCAGLTSIAELGRSLVALTNLQQLTVDLGGCEGLTSIAELGHSWEALTNLQQLTVDLGECEGLTSIAELGRSLVALTNLQQLTVDLYGCRGLPPHLRKFFRNRADLVSALAADAGAL